MKVVSCDWDIPESVSGKVELPEGCPNPPKCVEKNYLTTIAQGIKKSM
jgi:hypothetical protein